MLPNDFKLATPEVTSQFIELYKSMPCLWQIKSAEYMDRNKKDAAYKELLKLCQSVCPEANVNTVKTKIANLRTVYRKETKKVKYSQRSGAGVHDLYVPKLWYYELLHFISDQEEPRDSTCSLDPQAVPSAEAEASCETDEELQTNTASAENSTKFPHKSQQSTTRNKAKKRTNKDAMDEYLEKAHEVLNSKSDEHEIFGANLACKLRKMNEDQLIRAEYLINDIVYKALRNQLTDNTCVTKLDSHPPSIGSSNLHFVDWQGTTSAHVYNNPNSSKYREYPSSDKIIKDSDEHSLEQLLELQHFCLKESERWCRRIKEMEQLPQDKEENAMTDRSSVERNDAVFLPVENVRVHFPVEKGTKQGVSQVDEGLDSGEEEEALARRSIKRQSQMVVEAKSRRRNRPVSTFRN